MPAFISTGLNRGLKKYTLTTVSFGFDMNHLQRKQKGIILAATKTEHMNKIIAAMDGLKYSTATEQCAIDMAKQTGSHLTGVFLDDFTYSSFTVYQMVQKNDVSEKAIRQYSEKDKKTRDKAAEHFENACRKAGVQYNVHRDRNISIQDLLHESIYADLLVIDQKETFTHYEEKTPTGFIRELLSEVQCPVLLVNKKYIPFEKLILLYDGGPSAVYAVKMFSYLLPSFSSLPADVLAAKGFYGDLHLPDNRLMKELMKRHYPKASYEVLKGQPQTEIISRLKKEKEGTLVVLGSNRRGALSRWFKESMADILMEKIQGPLFVAYHK